MYRVLPLLLMIGLIAFAPLALSAQDKDKDAKVDVKADDKKADDKKADDKKADDKKADDKKADEKPPEVPVVKKGEDKPAVVEVIPSRLELALSYVPFISLVLIAVLFMLVLSLRSSVSQLEEKIKGGS